MVTKQTSSNIVILFVLLIVLGIAGVIVFWCSEHTQAPKKQKYVDYPEEFFPAVSKNDTLIVEKVSQDTIYLGFKPKHQNENKKQNPFMHICHIAW